MTTSGWSERVAARVARGIKAAREAQTPKLSVAKLAERTAELGYSMSRTVIADLELGRRRGIDVAELLVLAAALEVPAAALLFPDLPDGVVEYLPDRRAESIWAVQHFVGEVIRPPTSNDEAKRRYLGQDRIRLSRDLAVLRARRDQVALEFSQRGGMAPDEHLALRDRQIDPIDKEIERLEGRMRAAGWPVHDEPFDDE